MKKILFKRRKGVYLPEISAYMAYLRDRFPAVQAYDSSTLAEGFSESAFDVVWEFMGFDTKSEGDSFLVHEYGSLSVGKFPRIKNLIKRQLNVTPDRHVFLNDIVRRDMGFRDSIPYRLRDMGISGNFFRDAPASGADFDFVYSGSLNRGKIISAMLDHFRTKMKGCRLLVVGAVPDDIHQTFGETANITFTGRIKYEDVPDTIRQARYGLNIMPDIYPYNVQTSTKVLEYCAAAIPVVSTDYKWIRDFEARAHGKFFFVDNDLDNLSLENLEKHPFTIPSLKEYEWSRIIENSGVFDFLKTA